MSFSGLINGSASYNQAVFELDPLDGSLTIESEDVNLQPKVYNVDITATALSGQVTESFIINFADLCQSVAITGANPWFGA